jgi:hypothetical protein
VCYRQQQQWSRGTRNPEPTSPGSSSLMVPKSCSRGPSKVPTRIGSCVIPPSHPTPPLVLHHLSTQKILFFAAFHPQRCRHFKQIQGFLVDRDCPRDAYVWFELARRFFLLHTIVFLLAILLCFFLNSLPVFSIVFLLAPYWLLPASLIPMFPLGSCVSS